MATHEVFNQVAPLVGHDPSADPALRDGLRHATTAIDPGTLRELGVLVGSEWTAQRRRDADVHKPVLRTHDATGRRIDEVEFHPAWHELMAAGTEHGVHAAAWADPSPDAHLLRTARYFLWTQAEMGTCCPLTMTYAAVPVLRREPELAAAFEPGLVARAYDPQLRPAQAKPALLAGMAMTEKQGGSDLRANTTRAVPSPADGATAYRLTGHKWFCSAPMSDLFLVLAQAPGGLTCLLLPRVLPDGTRNAMHLQRLKDKLGNRSNASAEVDYDGALAFRIGAEGRGVPTIIEMVNATRLDCLVAAAGGMRFGVHRATHHARRRSAFGRPLVEHAAMRNVLADLAVESEAAIALALRLGAAVDRSLAGDAAESHLRRLATAVGKYWTCKRWAVHAAESLECLGGNGYTEDYDLARNLREAPLPSIWEGSGNVAALDVLRAAARSPEAVGVYLDEVALAAGADARFDEALRLLRKDLADTEEPEYRARRTVERLALLLQGSLLLRYGHPAVADAFCASRLGGDWGVAFGTLPSGLNLDAVLDRAAPSR